MTGMEFRNELYGFDPYGGFDYKSHPQDNHGWGGFMDKEFEWVVSDLMRWHKLETVVEVGTWKGSSAIAMALALRNMGVGAHIVCVDTWLGSTEFLTWGIKDPSRGLSLKRVYGYPTVYYQFLANVCHFGVSDMITPLPIDSGSASEVLLHYGVQADMVYVDASHEEEAVYRDLVGYDKILSKGGFICGDDHNSIWPGVVRAVKRFSEERSREVSVFPGGAWVMRSSKG